MKIRIFHTNDIHSHFDRLAEIASFLKEQRHPQDLVFDCGDLCDLKSTMIQGTCGQGAIKLLKTIGYDAICIGNNEIDLKKKTLGTLSEMGLPIVSCNVLDEEKKQIGSICQSLIIERQGIHFLVIGVSPFYNENMEPDCYNQFFLMGDIQSVDPLPSIQRELEKYRDQYDLCILLSHSGLAVDQQILKQFKEIDICLGGHSHSLVQKERYSQAGKYGQYIGIVEIDIENRQVRDISMHIEKNHFKPDQRILNILKEEQQKADQALSIPLYAIETLTYDPIYESTLVNFICDALFEEYPCDFTFMNAGIVNSGISGEISKKKLLELSPSKLNSTRFPVLGKNLREAIEKSFDQDFVMQSGRGAGYRGQLLGTLGFSANVRIDKRTMKIFINDRLLDDHRVYDCVANDYLQRGSGYPSFKTDDSQATFYDGFIRDLLERNLNKRALREKAKIKRVINE